MMYKTDFLVIGSGLAGLSFSRKMALKYPDKTVTIVTKGDITESNTSHAQGGIAVVMDALHNNFAKHKNDTVIAGDGLCNEAIVDLVVKDGPDRLQEIIALGVAFDKTKNGTYHLGIEGAHSTPRILHCKDQTGLNIQKVLIASVLALPNVEVRTQHFAIDLITQHHLDRHISSTTKNIECYGAYVMDLKSSTVETITARATLLASGGIGQVYNLTTNPEIATGDGIAMAYRARARVKHMQFVQFHPTALYGENTAKTFLISEAVRGFCSKDYYGGAILKTEDGKPFMKKYDERGSLASRDIVARAIDMEMKKNGTPYVYLDCRHLDKEEFAQHFPYILKKCETLNIDIAHDMIPVAPAAHYLCGGVATDSNGQTSIDRLYCCGETACTGLHGANRLASNSLLEALVFAHRCYKDVVNHIDQFDHMPNVSEWQTAGTMAPEEWVLINHNKQEIKQIMSHYVGIVRSNERLHRALNRLDIIYKETEKLYKTTSLSPQLCELRNMINVAYLIITQSIRQQENKGTFYNIDRAKGVANSVSRMKA